MHTFRGEVAGFRTTKMATQILSILLSMTDEESRRIACYLEGSVDDSIPLRLRKTGTGSKAGDTVCQREDGLIHPAQNSGNTIDASNKTLNGMESHTDVSPVSTRPLSSAGSSVASDKILPPRSASGSDSEAQVKQRKLPPWSRGELGLLSSLMAQHLPRKEIVMQYQIWCLRMRKPHRTSNAIFFRMAILRKAERERGCGRPRN